MIAKKILKDFWESHPDAKTSLEAWYYEAKAAQWASPGDVKRHYGTSSILKGGRVVFNIGGNKYRLVVWINYGGSIVYIKFIGTHKEYDSINAEEI